MAAPCVLVATVKAAGRMGRTMAYERTVDVRFRDLDPLNHVNSSVYFSYMEHARVEFLIQEAGARSAAELPIILASARVEYRKPLAGSRRVTVRMWVSRIGGKSWDFDYQVLDAADGTVFAEGRTVQVAYSYKEPASVPIPDELRQLLERHQDKPIDLRA